MNGGGELVLYQNELLPKIFQCRIYCQFVSNLFSGPYNSSNSFIHTKISIVLPEVHTHYAKR